MMNKIRRFAALVSAVMMTLVCAVSFPKNAGAAEEINFNALVDEIAVLVNEARAEEGLAPMFLSPYLCEVADIRANECSVSFSHTRPDGQNFFTAIDYNEVPYTKISENIAAGNSTAEETFEQWKNSPSHWAAIMNPSYTHIGIGVKYVEGSMYGWYWTQAFAAVNTSLEGQRIVERNQLLSTNNSDNQSASQFCGDVNGDGSINSFDYIALSQHIFGGESLSELQLEACDVMQDGSVNIADVIILRRYILGSYESLPITPDMI